LRSILTALLWLGAPAYSEPLACRVLTPAEISRAIGQPVTQVVAVPAAPTGKTSNCQWPLTHAPRASLTLTIDAYAPKELDAAWRSALDTYLHAGRMVQNVGAPAMWVPKKWGTTGLLYVKARSAVCVLSVPQSATRDLNAAKALAKLAIKRLALYSK
jgi:hypothetical protein